MTKTIYEKYMEVLNIGDNLELEKKIFHFLKKQEEIDDKKQQKLNVKQQKLQEKILKKQQKQQKKQEKILKKQQKQQEKKEKKKLSRRDKRKNFKNVTKDVMSAHEVIHEVCPLLDEKIGEKIKKKILDINSDIMELVDVNGRDYMKLYKLNIYDINVKEVKDVEEVVSYRSQLLYRKCYDVLKYIQTRIFCFILYNNLEDPIYTIKTFTIDNGTKTNNLDTLEQKYYYTEDVFIPVLTDRSNYEFLENLECRYNMLYHNRKEEDIMTFLTNSMLLHKYYYAMDKKILKKIIRVCKIELKYEETKDLEYKSIAYNLMRKVHSEGVEVKSMKWLLYNNNTAIRMSQNVFRFNKN